MHFRQSEKWRAGISYIVPAYNCEGTISATINSILNGNFSDADEIVIVNDASTDRTAETILRLSKAVKNMRVIQHESNLGGGAARNTAVEAAKNELIFCLDSDNLLLPGSVPMLAAFLLQKEADAAAFGGQKLFEADPRMVSAKWWYKPGQIKLSDLLCGYINPASSGNYIFSRRSWVLAGKYPDWAGALDTWGFGLRQIGDGGKFVIMPKSYYLHRWGYDSYWIRWSQERTNKQMSSVALTLLSPYLEMLCLSSQRWVTSEEEWFGRLREHPLLVKSGGEGIDGVAYRTVRGRLWGIAQEIHNYGVKSFLSRRLKSLKARQKGTRHEGERD